MTGHLIDLRHHLILSLDIQWQVIVFASVVVDTAFQNGLDRSLKVEGA
jgi:hypothetical protein